MEMTPLLLNALLQSQAYPQSHYPVIVHLQMNKILGKEVKIANPLHI